MKVERGHSFTPIVITLEDLREAKAIFSILRVGEYRVKDQRYLTDSDRAICNELIRKLQSEGITEIGG